MHRDWKSAHAPSTPAAPTTPITKPPISDWIQLGRAVLAEASRRTTQELIARRCGKIRRAVQGAIDEGRA